MELQTARSRAGRQHLGQSAAVLRRGVMSKGRGDLCLIRAEKPRGEFVSCTLRHPRQFKRLATLWRPPPRVWKELDET